MADGSDKTVDTVDAHIVITSVDLSLGQMVELVGGIEPDESWRRGDENPEFPEDSRFRVFRTSGIRYRSRLERGEDGEKHVDDLISLLREREGNFAGLTKHPAAEAMVSIGSYSTYHLQSFLLSAADIQLLSRLDISVWIVCGQEKFP